MKMQMKILNAVLFIVCPFIHVTACTHPSPVPLTSQSELEYVGETKFLDNMTQIIVLPLSWFIYILFH